MSATPALANRMLTPPPADPHDEVPVPVGGAAGDHTVHSSGGGGFLGAAESRRLRCSPWHPVRNFDCGGQPFAPRILGVTNTVFFQAFL